MFVRRVYLNTQKYGLFCSLLQVCLWILSFEFDQKGLALSSFFGAAYLHLFQSNTNHTAPITVIEPGLFGHCEGTCHSTRPSKCHANFALDFSSLVFKFLSRLFSRILLDVLPDFFLDIFPDFFLDLFFDFFRYFFLDFFERWPHTSNAHSWVEVHAKRHGQAWFLAL